MARVLDISEGWLMGLDVPMEREQYVTAGEWTDDNKYILIKNLMVLSPILFR